MTTLDVTTFDFAPLQKTVRIMTAARGYAHFEDDAAQEAVAVALEQKEKGRFDEARGTFGSFAYQVAKSEVMDRVKRWNRPVYTPIHRPLAQAPRRAATPEGVDPFATLPAPSMPTEVEELQIVLRVRTLLEQDLSEQETSWVLEIWLSGGEVHPQQVIAKRENIPPWKLWRLIAKAKKRLAEDAELRALAGLKNDKP
jgi:DNA-directed RNA polymerase specialized sigma24 family protein